MNDGPDIIYNQGHLQHNLFKPDDIDFVKVTYYGYCIGDVCAYTCANDSDIINLGPITWLYATISYINDCNIQDEDAVTIIIDRAKLSFTISGICQWDEIWEHGRLNIYIGGIAYEYNTYLLIVKILLCVPLLRHM